MYEEESIEEYEEESLEDKGFQYVLLLPSGEIRGFQDKETLLSYVTDLANSE